MEWHRKKPGMASTEDTPEQQDRATSQKTIRASAQITNNKKSGEPAVSRVLSRTVIHLEYMSPCISSDLPGSIVGHDFASLFDLAPSGVYLAAECCHQRGALLPHPFTLTGHPIFQSDNLGGLLSAALSVGSHPPGVTWHSALWSPDFPLSNEFDSDCLADSPVYPILFISWALLKTTIVVIKIDGSEPATTARSVTDQEAGTAMTPIAIDSC